MLHRGWSDNGETESDSTRGNHRQREPLVRQLFRPLSSCKRRCNARARERSADSIPGARPRDVVETRDSRRPAAVLGGGHSVVLCLCAPIQAVRQLFHRCWGAIDAQPSDAGRGCVSHRQQFPFPRSGESKTSLRLAGFAGEPAGRGPHMAQLWRLCIRRHSETPQESVDRTFPAIRVGRRGGDTALRVVGLRPPAG